MFPPGCNHTQTLHCLPTCLGKMPDDCSIHACSWFSGKPSKIHPYWTKTWNSYWSWKRKKKKNQQNSYYISVQFTQKLPHSDPSTAQDCSWRLVREESKHGALIFLWNACTATQQWELMDCSNGIFFSCFNLKNKTKPTSISNKNNPKQFLQFWNIQKDTSPHCGYIKKKKELNKSKDRFNAKNTEENMHAFIIFLNYTGKLTVMEPAFPELMKQQSKRKKKEKRAFCSLKSLL